MKGINPEIRFPRIAHQQGSDVLILPYGASLADVIRIPCLTDDTAESLTLQLQQNGASLSWDDDTGRVANFEAWSCWRVMVDWRSYGGWLSEDFPIDTHKSYTHPYCIRRIGQAAPVAFEYEEDALKAIEEFSEFFTNWGVPDKFECRAELATGA